MLLGLRAHVEGERTTARREGQPTDAGRTTTGCDESP